MKQGSLFLLTFTVLSSVVYGGSFFPRPKGAPAEPEIDVPPAQRPIERAPGISKPSLEMRLDSEGRNVITRIDRNNDTVKQWVKDKVISEEQIKQVESGKPVTIDLPDAH